MSARLKIIYPKLFDAIRAKGFDPDDRQSQIAFTKTYNAFVKSKGEPKPSRNMFKRIFDRTQKASNPTNALLICEFLEVYPKEIFEKKDGHLFGRYHVLYFKSPAEVVGFWGIERNYDHIKPCSLLDLVAHDKYHARKSRGVDVSAVYEELDFIYKLFVNHELEKAFDRLASRKPIDYELESSKWIKNSFFAHKIVLCYLVFQSEGDLPSSFVRKVVLWYTEILENNELYLIRPQESENHECELKIDLTPAFEDALFFSVKRVHLSIVLSYAGFNNEVRSIYSQVFEIESLLDADAAKAQVLLNRVGKGINRYSTAINLYYSVLLCKNEWWRGTLPSPGLKVTDVQARMIKELVKMLDYFSASEESSTLYFYEAYVFYTALAELAGWFFEAHSCQSEFLLRSKMYWKRCVRGDALERNVPMAKGEKAIESMLLASALICYCLAVRMPEQVEKTKVIRAREHSKIKHLLDGRFKQLFYFTMREGFGGTKSERLLAIHIAKYLLQVLVKRGGMINPKISHVEINL